MGKPEILPTPTIITQLCMGNYVGEPYPTQHFTTIRSVVFDPSVGEIVFTRLISFVGSSDSRARRPLQQF